MIIKNNFVISLWYTVARVPNSYKWLRLCPGVRNNPCTVLQKFQHNLKSLGRMTSPGFVLVSRVPFFWDAVGFSCFTSLECLLWEDRFLSTPDRHNETPVVRGALRGRRIASASRFKKTNTKKTVRLREHRGSDDLFTCLRLWSVTSWEGDFILIMMMMIDYDYTDFSVAVNKNKQQIQNKKNKCQDVSLLAFIFICLKHTKGRFSPFLKYCFTGLKWIRGEHSNGFRSFINLETFLTLKLRLVCESVLWNKQKRGKVECDLLGHCAFRHLQTPKTWENKSFV